MTNYSELSHKEKLSLVSKLRLMRDELKKKAKKKFTRKGTRKKKTGRFTVKELEAILQTLPKEKQERILHAK